MKNILSISSLVIFGILAPISSPLAMDSNSCDAVELVHGAKDPNSLRYNALICEAETSLEKEDNSRALELLSEAKKVPLFERPNVLLYPLTALTKHRLGDTKGALDDIKRAELVLMVLTGIATCTDTELNARIGGLSLGMNFDYYGARLTSDIAREMCWPGYQGFFTRELTTLGRIKWEYRLLERIEGVKSEVDRSNN
jgi:hypothetical protein